MIFQIIHLNIIHPLLSHLNKEVVNKLILRNNTIFAPIKSFQQQHKLIHRQVGEINFSQEHLEFLVIDETGLLFVYQSKEVKEFLLIELPSDLE